MGDNLLISLKIIELSAAILNNDLDSMKELVEYFNAQSNLVYSENGFNIYDFDTENINEAFQYLLDNLTTYPRLDKFKWEIYCGKLIAQCNKKLISEADVLKIINDTLNSEDLKEYQFGGLIRLANVSHNYNVLIEIKNRIINGV